MNSLMETICTICNSVRASSKQGLSFQKLLNKIRKEFKFKDITLQLRTVRDKTLNSDVFYANGYYDPENDLHGDCAIELIITHNFPKDHVWFPEQATDILVQIFDTTVHEFKHRRQFVKRNYQFGSERGSGHKEYLADPDEIDAYSISIAIELCRSMGKIRALRYLNSISKLGRFKLNNSFVSPSLSMYLSEFPNIKDPVIKQLAKKVYVRLMKVDTDYVFL
jgi:hypothetical protein